MERNSIRGTRTEQNLMQSFSSEAIASTRYLYYANAARKEGYEQVASIFIETSQQEREHARLIIQLMEGGRIPVCSTLSADRVGSTADNLQHAKRAEWEEWQVIYPRNAKVAQEEGLKDAANLFQKLAECERAHTQRFDRLLQAVDGCWVFSRGKPVFWQCRNCGFIIESQSAPATCPACHHPQAYFEIMQQNY